MPVSNGEAQTEPAWCCSLLCYFEAGASGLLAWSITVMVMTCFACLLAACSESEAVEQVGICADSSTVVRRRARDTGEWYSAPYRASQLGCVVWFLWMALAGPLEYRYLTCAKVSERVVVWM